jgi:signal transduction histidine kinase
MLETVQENPEKNKIRLVKAGRVLDTITDVGSLAITVVYFLYVTLLLFFDMGTPWLNYAMLVITILYFAFFITKIFSLNRLFEKKRYIRTARFALKYSKWAMKLINAVFVMLSIATTQSANGGGDVMMMVGVFIVVLSFAISILWDVVFFIFRRKFRVIWQGWESLSRREKNERIETIIGSFVNNFDALAGVNLAESVRGAHDKHNGILIEKDEEMI